MEQMLAHLTSASAQAAAASLVSGGPQQPGVHHPHTCWHNCAHYIGMVSLSIQPQPTLHSAPCSPPARRTSAPSAMLTLFLLCSSPVAISPASKWAPWVQRAREVAGIHRPSSSSCHPLL